MKNPFFRVNITLSMLVSELTTTEAYPLGSRDIIQINSMNAIIKLKLLFADAHHTLLLLGIFSNIGHQRAKGSKSTTRFQISFRQQLSS